MKGSFLWTGLIPGHYDVLYFPGWYSEWSDSWAYLHMAFISRQVRHNKWNAIRWRNAPLFISVYVMIICIFIRFVLMVWSWCQMSDDDFVDTVYSLWMLKLWLSH